MTPSFVIKVGSDDYTVSLGADIEVEGNDSRTVDVIQNAVARIRMEYSPAYGSVAAYVSRKLATNLKATVASVQDYANVAEKVY
jgi:hypothetical protein